MRGVTLWSAGLLCLGFADCQVESLFISAGAPVGAVVRGRITFCGSAVDGAEVLLLVQQSQPEQNRPVDTSIGPVTTSRDGRYLLDVGPSFAVPGPASVQLRVTSSGTTRDITGGTLQLRMGTPPSDTTRFDADLGVGQGAC